MNHFSTLKAQKSESRYISKLFCTSLCLAPVFFPLPLAALSSPVSLCNFSFFEDLRKFGQRLLCCIVPPLRLTGFNTLLKQILTGALCLFLQYCFYPQLFSESIYGCKRLMHFIDAKLNTCRNSGNSNICSTQNHRIKVSRKARSQKKE